MTTFAILLAIGCAVGGLALGILVGVALSARDKRLDVASIQLLSEARLRQVNRQVSDAMRAVARAGQVTEDD